MPPARYRTIWLSDLHLGTRRSRTHYLMDFLRCNRSDRLFLVGDIIDVARMERWTDAHQAVLATLSDLATAGTRVDYLRGNHDPDIHRSSFDLSGFHVTRRIAYPLANGSRALVLHGDEFDTAPPGWLYWVGDSAYTTLLATDRPLNALRSRLGLPFWSATSYVKSRLRCTQRLISAFEDNIAEEAQRHGCDVVICGHVHSPQMRFIGNVLYCNDGDFVESCTALVEDHDGTLALLRWTDRCEVLARYEVVQNQYVPDSAVA